MKILIVNSYLLRNEEWFQLDTEFKNMVLKYTPGALSIDELFVLFLALYGDADTALEVIRKSSLTADINEAERKRNHLFHGLDTSIRGFLYHFDPTLQEASRNLIIVLDTFGNIAKKPADEATAAFYNLGQELLGPYRSYVEELQMVEWVEKLEAANHEYEQLVSLRNEEIVGRTTLRMKEIRKQVTEIYRQMAARIEANELLNPNQTPFAPFIDEWNGRIKHYKDILAQRKGRKAANTKEN
jgi:hypothetical protein